MSGEPAIERLRITPRSLVIAIAMFGGTLALLRLVASSTRVIGWALAAIAIAGLLHPLVLGLSRHMRRGLALLVVVLLTLTCIGVITYGLVNGLVRSTHKLQDAAPELASRLERHGRFHQALADAHLADRTRNLVKQVPQRLQGGTPAEAFRAATTRGLAFLATGILTVFFLIYGDQLATSALEQVHDPVRRARWRRISEVAAERALGYARGSIAMAALAGLLGYMAASAAHVPGAAPLALWVALWDLVPIVGVAIGAVPIVVLAAAGSTNHAIAIAVVFAVYQVLEAGFIQPWVERRSVRIGPFATVAGGAAGIELYGIGGALLFLLAITVVVAIADELTPTPSP